MKNNNARPQTNTEDSFEDMGKLVREVMPTIRRVVIAYCTEAISESDIDDVTQDAIIRLWKTLRSRQEPNEPLPERIEAYSAIVARHTAMDHLRKSISDNQHITSFQMKTEETNFLLQKADENEDLEKKMVNAEQKHELNELIGTLPRSMKQIVLLRYMGDFSIPEISKKLSIPEGTVKASLHRAVQKLRNALIHAGKIQMLI